MLVESQAGILITAVPAAGYWERVREPLHGCARPFGKQRVAEL
jgi:hypothetical protein